ncbi:hypothetical protein [Streptomyces sp. SID7909]|uniref:hypothetical protein n=1 Tax=Streptomyces sp. SID7909 TaxID=2706092 RepID=UPI0013BE5FCB|nr:hypothetical protein [Streptomyces sp. SID7909]NEC04449.1 hypothetical protein [Streptomyces sp. SID7909]
MERLRSGDAGAAGSALGTLIGLCANDMRAAVAPTVPFLMRMGPDPDGRHRAEALNVVGELARMGHHGVHACRHAAVSRQ